jgi:hypothetical protein
MKKTRRKAIVALVLFGIILALKAQKQCPLRCPTLA